MLTEPVTPSMPPADQTPTLADLRQLSTLHDLSGEELSALASRLRIAHAKPGEVLLERGSTEDCTLYLLEGRLRLTADDGRTREFDHRDPSAHDPIARLRPSHYQVTAVTPLSFLRIDNALLADLHPDSDTGVLLESYQVSEENEFSDMSADNQLMVQIYQDLNADQLVLPTLPQIAARISHAMQDPGLDANKLATLISADPAIAAKLLKAANSPRFGGKVQINTLSNAVARLGLNTTHELVLSFAVRELFRTGSGTLKQHMRQLWRHSRRVAAISHVLASRLGKPFDPAVALLAGLLHDIGVVAILSYARSTPELSQDERQLNEAVAKLRGPLGSAIVRRWHLPEALAEVAEHAEHWEREHSAPADYADLIIIAQLHCFVGSEQAAKTPRINQVPAFHKLELDAVTPAFSLQLLEQAREEILEVEALLGE
jgi:HD-like signal output (HDOD) protein